MTHPEPVVHDRRNRTDPPISAYFKGDRTFFDAKEGINVVKIISGDWHVSSGGGEMLTTILGSCISACIRDPAARVGGMNHFLLPGDGAEWADEGDGARYGVFAMECLINGILKAGGMKSRLEVKVFGGGNVINSSARIGSKNAAFVRGFLKKEGYSIASEDLEGDLPRRVHYYPDTGKVMLRHLRRKEDLVVAEEENRYRNAIAKTKDGGGVELF